MQNDCGNFKGPGQGDGLSWASGEVIATSLPLGSWDGSWDEYRVCLSPEHVTQTSVKLSILKASASPLLY